MNTIILDDGIEYAIIKEIKINNTTYTLFANVNDGSDICLRKTIIENNEEYYTGLDNKKEFDLVMSSFSKNILEEIKERDNYE